MVEDTTHQRCFPLELLLSTDCWDGEVPHLAWASSLDWGPNPAKLPTTQPPDVRKDEFEESI